MTELQSQCWICPQCHDDKHHTPGDEQCLRQQIENLNLELAEVKNAKPALAAVPNWQQLQSLADDYVDGYEFRGDEGDYQPNEKERFLIEDCVAGLIDEIRQLPNASTPKPVDASQPSAIKDVIAERQRQDKKWGGPDHDDQHSPNDFVQLIQDYAGWARVMAGMNSLDKYRRRMVQVAALAVAAVETTDRALNRDQTKPPIGSTDTKTDIESVKGLINRIEMDACPGFGDLSNQCLKALEPLKTLVDQAQTGKLATQALTGNPSSADTSGIPREFIEILTDLARTHDRYRLDVSDNPGRYAKAVWHSLNQLFIDEQNDCDRDPVAQLAQFTDQATH